MDFAYYYKTHDGIRHEAEISAPSRDEAFAALRKIGIRPIKVVAIDDRRGGSWHVKRWIGRVAVVTCSVMIGVLAVRIFSPTGKTYPAEVETVPVGKTDGIAALPRPRAQIPGFADIDLSSVFGHPSEAYLAKYAQPGSPGGEGRKPQGLEEDLISHLKTPVLILPQDTPAVRDLKSIVVGIKNDIALLLASGQGINDILAWLEARQKMEATYRERIINERKHHASSREKTNRLLRTLGLAELQP